MRKLLADLVRRGQTAYVNFLYCLDNSGHQHLADFIRDTESEIRNANAHHPADSSNHGDRHLHASASAEPLSQHNLSNQIYSSHSLQNLSSSDSMVTSTSDESASNNGNTTDYVRMENDSITDESNTSS